MYRGSTWCDDDRVTARREAKARHAYRVSSRRDAGDEEASVGAGARTHGRSGDGDAHVGNRWPDSVSVTTPVMRPGSTLCDGGRRATEGGEQRENSRPSHCKSPGKCQWRERRERWRKTATPGEGATTGPARRPRRARVDLTRVYCSIIEQKSAMAVFQANLERIERSDESAASWVIPLFFAIGGGRLLSRRRTMNAFHVPCTMLSPSLAMTFSVLCP